MFPFRKNNISICMFLGTFDGTIGIVAQGAIALVLWYGGKLVHEGTVTPGILTCMYFLWGFLYNIYSLDPW